MKKILFWLAVISAVGCHEDDHIDDLVDSGNTGGKLGDILGEYQAIRVFEANKNPVIPYTVEQSVEDRVLLVEKISESSIKVIGYEMHLDDDGKFSCCPDAAYHYSDEPEVAFQNDTIRIRRPVRRYQGIYDLETFIGVKGAKSPLKAGTVGFRSQASDALEGESSYVWIYLDLVGAKLGAKIVIEIPNSSTPVSLGEYGDRPYSGVRLVDNKILLTVMPNTPSASIPIYFIDDLVLHPSRKIELRISDESVGITPSDNRNHTLTMLDNDVYESSVNKIIFSVSDAINGKTWVSDIKSDGSVWRNRLEFTDAQWPTFSPDGNRVVFVRKEEGGKEEVYTTDFSGDDLKRLTNNDRTESYPSYAPAGDKILFVARVQESPMSSQIFSINPDGSGETQISHISNGTEPLEIQSASWSPAGTQIIFSSNLGNEGFGYRNYIMNADGSNVRRLTDKYRSERHPRFSPDGQKIIFNVGSGLGENIYLMNADGSGEQKLFTDVPGFTARDAEWSPDGATIIFQGRIDLADFSTFKSNIDGSNFGEMLRTRMDHASWSPAK